MGESKKSYSLFIGRFQPLHKGHQKLIQSVLDEGKNVCVGLKDMPISKKDPYTIEQRKRMFEIALPSVEVFVVPDIDEVCHGRTVGWDIREIKLDEETEAISSTGIRNGDMDQNIGYPARMMQVAMKRHFKDASIVGVEVGASRGNNAQTMLEDFSNITKLHLVDSFPTYIDFMDETEQKNNKFILTTRFKDNPKIEIILDTSVSASKQFEDKSIDFVYLDANHAYEHVSADIKAWLPKVKDGGMIGGHDYDYSGVGVHSLTVKQAVDEIFDKKDIHVGLTIQKVKFDDEIHSSSCDWWVLI